MGESITFGASWGVGFAIVLVVALVAIGIALWVAEEEPLGVLFHFSAVMVILFTLSVLYPFSHEYHYWQTKQGIVSEATSRLLKDGNSVSEFVVVEFDDGFIGRCDDGRCKVLNKGDTVILRCKKEWQLEGTDGWDCRFVERKKAS